MTQSTQNSSSTRLAARLTLWTLRIGLSFIPLTQGAWASTSTCSPLKRVYYSAQFAWKESPTPQVLKIRVGRNLGNSREPSRLIALISSVGRCEAQCEIRSIEPGNSRSLTLDLMCRSQAFGPLAAPATLFVTPDRTVPSQIRFGTWLQGYKQAPLLVEMDRSSELVQPQPKPLAFAPHAEPGVIARQD